MPFINPHNDAAAHADLNIAPTVPISSLNVQTGAADAHLDLSHLNVSSLDMSIGAATAWIRFPENAGTTTAAHISGGASTITLEIPQGVAAQIQQRGGLSTFNIDQSRRYPLPSAIDLTNLTQTIRPSGGGATPDLLFATAIGFARGVLEIQLDSRWFVITLKEVSSRVSFLGYLKFFK